MTKILKNKQAKYYFYSSKEPFVAYTRIGIDRKKNLFYKK